VGHGKFPRYLSGIDFLGQLIKHGALASQILSKFQSDNLSFHGNKLSQAIYAA
jgi:hypothetical protein